MTTISTTLPDRILTEADLKLAVDALVTLDPILLPIVENLEIPLRNRTPDFAGMAQIVTSQMVSKAAAAAIFGRMEKFIHPLTAQNFLAAGTAPLIEAGQSRSKQATLTNLAHAIVHDDLELESLCKISSNEAIKKLTAIKGIGPWSAEVFLLFCAGHLDIFPAGDIALQHALADVDGLSDRPNAKQTRTLVERWQPLRGVAARVLYAHYAHIKGRTILPV